MNKEWLYHEYITLDQTVREVASSIGTTTGSIMWWLKKYGITKPKSWLGERHSKCMSGERNPAYVDGTSWKYQRNVLMNSDKPHRCVWCGATKRLQVHHVDHDRDNGDLDNLEWLCGPCNRMEAQIHSLERTGRATVERRGSTMILTFTGG